MARRCFLHVGAPKTGTTYLQDVLWSSTRPLRKQGFRLPLEYDDHFFLTLALRGRLRQDIDSPQALDVLDRLHQDLRRPGSKHVVISHELLAAVDQDQADELVSMLGDYEVHVIVTARDLARQVPAEWQQQVKTRTHVPYARFVEQVVSGRAEHFWSVQDLPSVAQRWGRRLPPERVHIVTVPPPGSPPEVLLTRFCAATGISPTGLNRGEARLNESIGYEQTELLRRVNKALGDRLPHPRSGYNYIVKGWFAETVLAEQEARQPLRLPTQHWDWCVGVAKETVIRLEQARYSICGDLEDLLPGRPPADSPHRPRVEDVSAAAIEAIATLLDERYQREEEVRHLSGRLAALRGGHNLLPGRAADSHVPGRLRASAGHIVRKIRV